MEQELVTLPPVKASSSADAAQPFQLLLVPTSSSGAAGSSNNNNGGGGGSRLGGVHRRGLSAETRLMTPNKTCSSDGLESGAKSGTVSVGVAVQVSTSSYVPAKGAQRRPQPPPIPPRNIRLTVNYPSETGGGGGSYKPMHQRPYREPPLMEESDSTDNKTADLQQRIQQQQPPTKTGRVSSSSQDDDSDLENSRSGMMPCVSNANDTSIESLVLEETALLLPATSTGRSLMRNITEKDEDTLI